MTTPDYDIDDPPIKLRPEYEAGWRALFIRIYGDVDTIKLWKGEAACAHSDPEAFFPEKGDFATAGFAQRVCQSCTIMDDCLNRAMTKPVEEYGIWGGATPRQRREARQWWNK